MLQVTRLAPQLLGESSDLVRDFVSQHIESDGGFRDRDGKSDIYYTVFGLENLLALDSPIPSAKIGDYLTSFGGGERLDLVHLSCLTHCWAALPGTGPAAEQRSTMLRRLRTFRAADGGFSGIPGNDQSDVYSSFLMVGAFANLGEPLPPDDPVSDFVVGMIAEDGGVANGVDIPGGTTPVTAAAVSLLRHQGRPVPEASAHWLARQRHPQGGFLAAPQAPIPDLLSTATAIHALAGLQYPMDAMVEPTLDFIDTLWTNRGGFHGLWSDDELDCEYTFYGLLALGHLSLWQ